MIQAIEGSHRPAGNQKGIRKQNPECVNCNNPLCGDRELDSCSFFNLPPCVTPIREETIQQGQELGSKAKSI